MTYRHSFTAVCVCVNMGMYVPLGVYTWACMCHGVCTHGHAWDMGCVHTHGHVCDMGYVCIHMDIYVPWCVCVHMGMCVPWCMYVYTWACMCHGVCVESRGQP